MKRSIARPDMTDINTETEVTKDISNNLGDIINQAKAHTKIGTKLDEKKKQVNEAKEAIKVIETISLAKAREGYERFLEIVYAGKELEKQKTIMLQESNPERLLQTAWNILLTRIDLLDKMQQEYDELLG